jgi:putative Mg2+ transporter-C (MgtC) family protein
MTFEIQIIGRLALAALLGALIGIERELKHKPLGLRTNMLIAVAGALAIITGVELSRRFGGDSGRLAAALIQGLGFLGAGAIIHGRSSVMGLTTAALLLVVAGVGLAAGTGAWILAISVTALTLFMLTTFGSIERVLHTKCESVSYSLKTADPSQLLVELNRVLGEHNIRMHGVHVASDGDGQRVDFAVCSSTDLNNTLLTRSLIISGSVTKQASVNQTH